MTRPDLAAILRRYSIDPALCLDGVPLLDALTARPARHQWRERESLQPPTIHRRRVWSCEECGLVVDAPACARTPGATPARVRVWDEAERRWEAVARLPECD